MSTWIVLALAVFAVAAAIVAFLRTPREQRYRGVRLAPLGEQLKNLPDSAQAVIIKGNRRQALVRAVPFIFIGLVLVGFSAWSKNAGGPECVRFLGVNAAYISLLIFCYGLPIVFLAASFVFFGMGMKTIRTGYFPPLDSVVFRDTIAKKGTASTFRGVALVVLPVFGLFFVYLGNNAYTAVAGGMTLQEITEKLEAKCPQQRTAAASLPANSFPPFE